MYDGASCHSSKLSLGWLKKHLPAAVRPLTKGEWPPYSPDLNPIELLWSIIQDRVIARQVETVDELTQVVVEEWWRVDQSTIRGLYDDLDWKIPECIEKEGGRFETR
jgi:transposase